MIVIQEEIDEIVISRRETATRKFLEHQIATLGIIGVHKMEE